MSDAFSAQQEMAQSVKQKLNPLQYFQMYHYFLKPMLDKRKQMKIEKTNAEIEQMNVEKNSLLEKGINNLSPDERNALAKDHKELGELRKKDPQTLTVDEKNRISALEKNINNTNQKALATLSTGDKEKFEQLTKNVTDKMGKLQKLQVVKGGAIGKAVDLIVKLLGLVYRPLIHLLPKRLKYRLLARVALTEKGQGNYAQKFFDHEIDKGRIDPETRQPIRGRENRQAAREARELEKSQEVGNTYKNYRSRKEKEIKERTGNREKTCKKIKNAKAKARREQTRAKAKAVSKSPTKRQIVKKSGKQARQAIKCRAAGGVKISRFKEMMLMNKAVKQVKTAQRLITLGSKDKKAINELVKRANKTVARLGGGVTFSREGKKIITKVAGLKK